MLVFVKKLEKKINTEKSIINLSLYLGYYLVSTNASPFDNPSSLLFIWNLSPKACIVCMLHNLVLFNSKRAISLSIYPSLFTRQTPLPPQDINGKPDKILFPKTHESGTPMMQDNNGGNRDREKEENKQNKP